MVELHRSILTPREQGILVRIARGLSNKEVAEDLFITTSAVKISLHQACIKLGAHNRAQAVRIALKRKAIDVKDFYPLEELADMLSSLGPEAVEKIAQIMRQKSEQSQQSGVKKPRSPQDKQTP